jgi:hypothetical protein
VIPYAAKKLEQILANQRSRFTHYYFYIHDEVLGPMVMRVASFFPFQTTCYLNGHSFIERELTRAQIGFRKNDNAFLAVDDVTALQAAADRLSRTSSANGLTTGPWCWGRSFRPRSARRSTCPASMPSRRSSIAATSSSSASGHAAQPAQNMVLLAHALLGPFNRKADAILDRIIHNAYRIELKGESMRKLKAANTEPDARKPVKEAPQNETASASTSAKVLRK